MVDNKNHMLFYCFCIAATTLQFSLAAVPDSLSSKQLRDTAELVVRLKAFSQYAIGVIIVTGIIGNVLCLHIFTTPVLRNKSPTQYLFALALADLAVLITIAITWLKSFGIMIYANAVGCKLLMYFSMVFSGLSAWFIVAFTAERFVIVYYPLCKDYVCTVSRARLIICIITVVGLLVNGWVPIAASVSHDQVLVNRTNQNRESVATTISDQQAPYNSSYDVSYGFECGLSPHISVAAATVFTYIEVILNVVLPAIVILFMNLAIAFKISRSRKRRKQLGCTPNNLLKRNAMMIRQAPPPPIVRPITAIFPRTMELETPSSNSDDCATDHNNGILPKQEAANGISVSKIGMDVVDLTHWPKLVPTGPGCIDTAQFNDICLADRLYHQNIGNNCIEDGHRHPPQNALTLPIKGQRKSLGHQRVSLVTRRPQNRPSTHELRRSFFFSAPRKRAYNDQHITMLLLTVSMVYLILNLPNAVNRCVNFAYYGSDDDESDADVEISDTELQSDADKVDSLRHQLVDLAVQLIFYLQYCVNFFLYSLQGRMYPNVYACATKAVDLWTSITSIRRSSIRKSISMKGLLRRRRDAEWHVLKARRAPQFNVNGSNHSAVAGADEM